jgi:hypothetical protein
MAQAQSLLGRDDTDHTAGGDLREHIQHEHERHASLVALVAAARASSHLASSAESSTTHPSALGAALRNAPSEVSAHIAAIIGGAPVQNHDEWFAACDPQSAVSDASTTAYNTARRDTEEAHHDVCDASSAAAAVACATTPGSLDCAYALSTLRSHACRGRAADEATDHPHIATCSSEERLVAAFPTCTARCVGAMHHIGNTCGFLVPRAGHSIHLDPGRHDQPAEEEQCDHAVREAQTHCAAGVRPTDNTEWRNVACMVGGLAGNAY